MTNERNKDSSEAGRIHRAIFGHASPPLVTARYEEACQRIEGLNAPDQRAEMSAVLARVRDLEALELAARWRGRLEPLVLRFRLMVRLAETLPENRDWFINRRGSRPAGWAAALGGGARTAWKLLKGLVLLKKVRRA